MKTRITALLAGLALAALLPATANAQGIRLGGQLNWADDADIGVGARASIPLEGISPRLELLPSFDFFFPGDDLTYWEFNGNFGYRILTENPDLFPYVGTGVNVATVSQDIAGIGDQSNTEVGLNLLAGVRFLTGRYSPYAEGRVEFSGGEQAVITVGVLYSLSEPTVVEDER